jgi:hypothetical protein
LKQHKRY